jgi:uncharacterized protein (DUF1684 family)
MITGCKNASDTSEQRNGEYRNYISSIESWRDKRVASLKENWLSLAGLFELQEGENTFGSNDTNDIVFPSQNAPDFMGLFFVRDGMVSVKIHPDVEVLNRGEKILEMDLMNDQDGSPTVLTSGSLKWFIIKRVDKVYVRLRDQMNPVINTFTGIEHYPLDTSWRISAQFEPHMTPKIIETVTTSGDRSQIISSGAVGFKIHGVYYRLDAWDIGNRGNLQTIFSDGTSGQGTYGAGRFVVIEKSKENDRYTIDFNKAYNPPCAFTEFATCPLPPAQNRLPVNITAGEKYSGESH